MGLLSAVVLVAGCGGATTGSTGVTKTSVTLQGKGRCASGEKCTFYWEYWKAGGPRSASVKTAVAGPVTGPVPDTALSASVSGLDHATTYRWTLCGSPNAGGAYGCVGPQGVISSPTADPPANYETFTTLGSPDHVNFFADVGRNPRGVDVDPTTGLAYVADLGDSAVSVVQGGEVVDTIGVGFEPSAVAVDPSTHTVYAANSGDDTVTVFRDRNVIATIAVGGAPAGIAVDPATHIAYVTDSDDARVTMVSGTAAIGSVTVGSRPEGVAVDSATGKVYVANALSDSVSVIQAGAVTGTIGVGDSPEGVAVDTATHRVYVANGGGDSVSVIDGGAVTATVPVDGPGTPFGVAVDPATHLGYVTSIGPPASVSVLKGGAVIDSIPVAGGPFGIAVDPTTHTAYVSGFDLARLSSIRHRPLASALAPADGSAGAPVTTNVHATFDLAMAHSPTAAAFTLKRTSDNAPVAGSVTFFGDGVPVFTPSSPLAAATQYTASISTGARDQTGNQPATATTWSFTTR